ncbi:MAG: prolyl oligopeptidase family serine peptidase [Candidatus Acidiferrum sp.]
MQRLLVALFVLTFSAFTQKSDSSHPFDYDSKSPLDTQDVGVDFRGTIAIYDFSYASPKGGRVPAYLVLPPGKGPFAAVIWGHWCWQNSEFFNRREFLNEAVALAPAGVASLLIDFPQARPGYVLDKDPLTVQDIDNLVQQVVDIRRGADLLLSRPFVDPKRLAYVGHSCGATAGGVVSGVDKRFRAFVLMAGDLSDEVASNSPAFQEFRQKTGPEKVDAFMAKYSWSDAGKYISHAAPAALFLQYSSQEQFLTPEVAKATAALASEPKQFKLYDAPHALNAEARRDRIAFLTQQLNLQPLSPDVIAAIPLLPQPPEPPH